MTPTEKIAAGLAAVPKLRAHINEAIDAALPAPAATKEGER